MQVSTVTFNGLNMSYSSLDIFDTLANIIPGLFFVLLLIILPPFYLLGQEIPNEFTNSAVLAILLPVIGYVLGYVLQSIASIRKDDEHQFESQLIKGFNRRNTIEYQFIKGSERYFKIRLTSGEGLGESLRVSKLPDLYWLVRSHLLSNDKTLSERWLVLNQFSRGIFMASLVSSVIYTLYLLYFFSALAIDSVNEIFQMVGNSLAFFPYSLIIFSIFLIIIIIVSNPIVFASVAMMNNLTMSINELILPALLLGVITVVGYLSYQRMNEYYNRFIASLIGNFYSNFIVTEGYASHETENPKLEMPRGSPTVSPDAPELGEINGIRTWPILLLRRLRIEVQQGVINELKKDKFPTRTGSLFALFTISESIIESCTDEIILFAAKNPREKRTIGSKRNFSSKKVLSAFEIDGETGYEEQVKNAQLMTKIEVLFRSNLISAGEKGQIVDAINSANAISPDMDTEYLKWLRNYKGKGNYSYDFSERPFIMEVKNARTLETKIGNSISAAQKIARLSEHLRRE